MHDSENDAGEAPMATNVANGIKLDLGQLTELGPHLFVGPVPMEHVPRYCLCKLRRRKTDGAYEPYVVSWAGMERITDQLPQKLGIKTSRKVLRALVKSRIVKGAQITPSVMEMDLADFARHRMESISESYWDARLPADPALTRREAYAAAWAEVNLGKELE